MYSCCCVHVSDSHHAWRRRFSLALARSRSGCFCGRIRGTFLVWGKPPLPPNRNGGKLGSPHWPARRWLGHSPLSQPGAGCVIFGCLRFRDSLLGTRLTVSRCGARPCRWVLVSLSRLVPRSTPEPSCAQTNSYDACSASFFVRSSLASYRPMAPECSWCSLRPQRSG